MLERKIWAFLNIKMMRVLKQVSQMGQKLKRVVKKKEVEYVSYSFERIRFKAVQTEQKKKNTRDSSSQTKIKSEKRIEAGSQKVINQTEEISYRM